jgi:parallel beta-helix repeat protein
MSTPYTIQAGDTLFSIAKTILGDGNLYTQITNASGTAPDPTQLQPGDVVYLPSAGASALRTAYTIQVGDTLFGIAQKILGNGNLYTQITNANGTTPNATQLLPGDVVYLPGSTTTASASPAAPATASPAVPSSASSVSGTSPGAFTGTSLPQPPNSINVKDYDATGDGSTDDQAALQNAFNAAAAQGKSVYIPAGTYNHSSTLSVSGTSVSGAGFSTSLVATDPSLEAIKLGSNSTLSNLKTFTSASSRDSLPDEAAVDVTGSNDSVSHLTIMGAESNGIRLDAASGAKVTGNLIEASNADGIALVNGASNNTISDNEVYQAGDDSYSDDSYTFDTKQDSGNVFSNDLALNNSYGRSFALMGSTGDTIQNSVSDGSKWMGIVAGTDSNSRTLNGSNDKILNNLITNSLGDAVDVMSPGGTLSQSGAGMNISGNSTSGSEASTLGFAPATNLTDRSQINSTYQPGTGNGANNKA